MVAVVSLLAKRPARLRSARRDGRAPRSRSAPHSRRSRWRRSCDARGRRDRALAGALLIGALGAAVAATGGQLRWFPLFVVGMVAVRRRAGGDAAAALRRRRPCAEPRPSRVRDRCHRVGRHARRGPRPAADAVREGCGRAASGSIELVGPFLFAAVLFVGRLRWSSWVRLRPDPLEVIGGIDPHAERTRLARVGPSSASVIRASPGATLGIAAMAASQAAMVGVMTMTPPHMKDHGHADLSAFVIARAHPRACSGWRRWSAASSTGAGAVRGDPVRRRGPRRRARSPPCSPATCPALMFVGLFLLGLGWNFGLIGGTTLLTASVPDVGPRRGAGHRRSDAQLCAGRPPRSVRASSRRRSASTSSPTLRPCSRRRCSCSPGTPPRRRQAVARPPDRVAR